MTFSDLGLSDELLRAVEGAGYSEPTPIQAQTIPAVLMGKDVIGVAQTGTGKTAAFVLPMIDILGQGRARARMPRSLIIAPTRELAQQVSENFTKYSGNHKLTMVLLIGGVAFGDQDKALQTGVDVLIVTPGRFLDQFERGKILLSGVEILVIDEADRMLDMGFIPDVERICSLLPPKRQTMLFSATMPGPVKKLADKFLKSPKLIEVSRAASTNANIAQLLVETTSRGKREALRRLLAQPEVTNAIVFSNRKTTVRDLYDTLKKAGVRVGQIHGDMEQADRLRELDRFKADEVTVLVASDVAARGLDIKGVTTVINYDTPHHPEDYVHRIGRTGRAGMTGTAYTLATEDDADYLREIEKLIGQPIPRVGAPVKAAAAAKTGTPEAADRDRDEVIAVEAEPAMPRGDRRRRGARAPTRSEPVRTDAARADPAPNPVEPASERAKPAPTRTRTGSERGESVANRADFARPRAPEHAPRERAPERDAPRAVARPPRAPAPIAADDRVWEGPVPAFLQVSARAA